MPARDCLYSQCGEAKKLIGYDTSLRTAIHPVEFYLEVTRRAEESKLPTCERLANLISVYCIVSWRISWLTTLNRTEPEAPPEEKLTKTEILILDKLMKPRAREAPAWHVIGEYLKKIARLGGYLARARDLPPGNRLIWKGM